MGERPVLDQLNIVVSDMEASVAFYRRLGLEVPDGPEPWRAHHRTVVVDGGVDVDLDSVAFAARWNEGTPRQVTPGSAVIGFRLPTREAVDATYADLTGAGYEGSQTPWDAFWGARYAVVRDPDGNPVGLMSPSDPARRWDPGPP